MPPPGIVSFENGTSVGAINHNIPVPTGVESGDIIVVFFSVYAPRYISSKPAEFTGVAGIHPQGRAYWKRAAGNDVGNYVFSTNSTATLDYYIARITGVPNVQNPIVPGSEIQATIVGSPIYLGPTMPNNSLMLFGSAHPSNAIDLQFTSVLGSDWFAEAFDGPRLVVYQATYVNSSPFDYLPKASLYSYFTIGFIGEENPVYTSLVSPLYLSAINVIGTDAETFGTAMINESTISVPTRRAGDFQLCVNLSLGTGENIMADKTKQICDLLLDGDGDPYRLIVGSRSMGTDLPYSGKYYCNCMLRNIDPISTHMINTAYKSSARIDDVHRWPAITTIEKDTLLVYIATQVDADTPNFMSDGTGPFFVASPGPTTKLMVYLKPAPDPGEYPAVTSDWGVVTTYMFDIVIPIRGVMECTNAMTSFHGNNQGIIAGAEW